MTQTSRVGAWLVICGCLSSAPAVQAAEPAPTPEYRRLVREFVAGRGVAAADALDGHTERWLRDAVFGINRDVPPWSPRERRAAALWHLEAVASGWVAPSRESLYLEVAAALVQRSPVADVGDRFRRRWLLTAAAAPLSTLAFGTAVPRLDALVAEYPDDAEALTTVGIAYELLGWTTEWPDGLPTDRRSVFLSAVSHRTQADALTQAARWYARALERDADHLEATLRLGRVRLVQGHGAEAVRLLTPTAARVQTPERQYLAALFLGGAHAQAGQWRAAAEAYARASRALPGCQTARLGLSALQQAQGRESDAADTLRAATSDTRDCDDPWWQYRFGYGAAQVFAWLRDLHAMVAP